MYGQTRPSAVLVDTSRCPYTCLADDGTHRRQPWFGCACCPPNIARLLAALPGYFYSLSDAGLWMHLYAQGSARIPLPDGTSLGLAQHTRYPWDG